VRKSPFLLILLFLLSQVLFGQTIKLASPVPEGSGWDNDLRLMAEEWGEITGGRVRVRIYPGGVAGNEADMVRKMRFGQIDAGIFTSFGLKAMVPESFVMTLPGLLQNEMELDYVLDNFTGRFDERFREEGFEILAWSKTGWAYIFAQNPIRTPDDLRKEILAVGGAEIEVSMAFKALGFNVVPMGLNEIMVSLQSGLVNSFYAPPVGAGAFQWFALAPFMTDYRLAPVIGGLVISRRTWERIPEQYHEELRASMVKLARKFYDESDRLNNEALRVMTQYDLQIISLTDSEKDDWMNVMMSGHDLMVGEGKAVPLAVYRDLLDQLEKIRN
jgi:TRAP-type C4-dicarboxylate transport system substrate-binding protein